MHTTAGCVVVIAHSSAPDSSCALPDAVKIYELRT
jgi:hypothetical protein